MDFFGHQEKAKTLTFWLFMLFILGLVIISVIATFAINWVLMFSLDKQYYQISIIQVLIPVVAVTLLMSLYKYLTLRPGGKVVAEALGGRLINKAAATPSERRLLNVVEEMAIAASLPVPPVYILDEELNINAFAAGFTINDAVIGVTRGTVEFLNRDELQAVIAHEFSHILNGDMRLNLRFTALFFGFLFLIQIATLLMRLILESRATRVSDKKAAGILIAIFLICCILIAAGWLSQLWARVMQAAINRQREYLADASSVQFTRHGSALASALKKIGGSATGATLQALSARTYNHFFFGQADTHLLATHPPLNERIKRIEPNWDGEYITPDLNQFQKVVAEKASTNHLSKESIAAAVVIGAGITATGADPIPYIKPTISLNGVATDEQQALTKLEAICQEPMDACYLVFALLMDSNATIRAKQLAIIKNSKLVTDYQQLLTLVPVEKHLEFIEKAIPALKRLSESQYKDFQKTMMHFINADNVISLSEWLLYQLISHQVGAQFSSENLAKPPKYTKLEQIKDPIQTLLSGIAWLSPNEDAVKRAFGIGANTLGLYTITLQANPSAAVLSISLKQLQASSEDIKKKFLRGVLRAIEQDQLITPEEVMFLHTLSLCLDCPVALPNIK